MTNRRSFIRNGSLLALAGLVRPSSLFASALGGGGKISLTQTDRDILDFVARYSTGQRLVGATVLAKLRGNTPASTRILVEVSDPGKFFSVFSTGPFASAHAEGNLVSFRHKDVGYAIENLVRDDFAGRLAALAEPKSAVFAHDALVYDPAMRRLSDPHGAAASREIRMINTGLTGTDASKAALRGIAEASEMGLEQGAEFGRWSARILASSRGYARSGVGSEQPQPI